MLPSYSSPKQSYLVSAWGKFSFVSLKRSTWTSVVILLAFQCFATLALQWLGYPPSYEVTNADLLYGKSVLLFLFIFLSVQYTTLGGLVLGIYNTLLLVTVLRYLDSLERRLTKGQWFIHGVSLIGIVGMRILLGYLFSQSTGWACPSLFFNDAIHETTYGLAQVILYCIACQAFGIIPAEGHPFTLLWLSFLLWLPNATRGPVFFWSFSTVSVTGIHGIWHLVQESKGNNLGDEVSHGSGPSKLSRLKKMVKRFFAFTTVFAGISYLHSVIHHWQITSGLHGESGLESLPELTLVKFLLLSYPRVSNLTILPSTLATYAPYLGGAFNATVYTTSSRSAHEALTRAETTFRRSGGIDFYVDTEPAKLPYDGSLVPGLPPTKQTFNLYSALSWAERRVSTHDTRYIGIMEDDFEWCDGSWNQLEALIWEVAVHEDKQKGEPFCGLFIATGGSGLLIRPTILPLLRQALQDHAAELNADILLQRCLTGELKLCSSCKLAASRRMLLRHTGSIASTYENRTYPEDRWQCGWRQPFNGRLGVWVP